MIKYPCPNCGEILEAPESLMGKALSCPSCKTETGVPNPKEDRVATSVREMLNFAKVAERTPSTGHGTPSIQYGTPSIQYADRNPICPANGSQTSNVESILTVFGWAAVFVDGLAGVILLANGSLFAGFACFVVGVFSAALLWALAEGLAYLRVLTWNNYLVTVNQFQGKS